MVLNYYYAAYEQHALHNFFSAIRGAAIHINNKRMQISQHKAQKASTIMDIIIHIIMDVNARED